MEPHNPENSRNGPGTSANQRRNQTMFGLIITLVALAVAVSATLISYQ
jgi:hypothetical protein